VLSVEPDVVEPGFAKHLDQLVVACEALDADRHGLLGEQFEQ
jgi:hypothetical protein